MSSESDDEGERNSYSEMPVDSSDCERHSRRCGVDSVAKCRRRSLANRDAEPVSPAAFGMASQGLRAASYDRSFCMASAAAFVFPPCLWLSAVWRRMDVYTAKFTYGFRLAMVAWPMLWLSHLLRRHLPDDKDNVERMPRAEIVFPVFCYVLVALVFVALYGVRQADCPLARRRRGGSWQELSALERMSSSGQSTDGTWRADDWDSFRLFVLPPPDRCPIVLKRVVFPGRDTPNGSTQVLSEYRERIPNGFIFSWTKSALLLAAIQPSVFPVWRW